MVFAVTASCAETETEAERLVENPVVIGGAEPRPVDAVPVTGVRVVQCGDGTMVDLKTGHHWEMKHPSDGDPDLENPHDVDNAYTWTSLEDGNATNPDGTLFVNFLNELNKKDQATKSCFAGHCDWRLPTKAELLSIRHAICRRPPCIDPEFGPNAGGPVAAVKYWSGDSVEGKPNFAWAVKFFAGRPNNTQKKFPLLGRAIRTGSCP